MKRVSPQASGLGAFSIAKIRKITMGRPKKKETPHRGVSGLGEKEL